MHETRYGYIGELHRRNTGVPLSQQEIYDRLAQREQNLAARLQNVSDFVGGIVTSNIAAINLAETTEIE